MTLRSFLGRARRAASRSPGYLLDRARESGRRRLQRPWARIYPWLVREKGLLEAAGATAIDALWTAQQDVPFFLSPARREAWTGEFVSRFPTAVDAIVAAADRTLRHEFDLLGSGAQSLGPALPWHTDFKTGREWPVDYARSIAYSELDRPTDVKVPWELSRCQHFTGLGQAYWLTGDERYAREFVDEVTDWMRRNPWAYGVNWACAMDVALRAVSWIWGFYYMAGSKACLSSRFRSAFLRSLYLHGEHVATHLERSDVNGNHYLCDGVGLVFLGAFFSRTAKGRRWLQMGRDIVVPEMMNQVSGDGVDFEQSTAYHRLVLEAFLTSYLLLDRHGAAASPEAVSRLERMLEFVEAYTKPDGSTPLIGDADDGRIQKLGPQPINDHRYLLSTGAVLFARGDFKRAAGRFWEESFWLTGPDGASAFDAVPPPSTPAESKAFLDGGFCVMRAAGTHVVVDCGEVGMKGRGGHGHNDILSVEVWMGGVNLVTDCGAYLYTASREWRNRFRSTEFHNVVQVDGEELNRFLGPDALWQLHYDARPRDVVWRPGDDEDCFRAGHSGYERLSSPVAVTRELRLSKASGDVRIVDSLEGDGVHDLVWRFHLAPAVSARIDGRQVCLTSAHRTLWLQALEMPEGAALAIENGWMSPSYGVREAIGVVTLRTRAALPGRAVFRFGATP